jgi:hypothetical protein
MWTATGVCWIVRAENMFRWWCPFHTPTHTRTQQKQRLCAQRKSPRNASFRGEETIETDDGVGIGWFDLL